MLKSTSNQRLIIIIEIITHSRSKYRYLTVLCIYFYSKCRPFSRREIRSDFEIIPTVWYFWFFILFHTSNWYIFSNIPRTLWCTIPALTWIFHSDTKQQNVRSFSTKHCKILVLISTFQNLIENRNQRQNRYP
jgi:hypothetical protein